MFKLNSVFAVLLAFQPMSFAQERDSLAKAFGQFKASNNKGYNQFVAQNDKDFADFLRGNWRTFEIHSGEEVGQKPKPSNFPDGSDTTPQPFQLDFNPPSNEIVLEDELVMPVNYQISTYDGIPIKTSFHFFGTPVIIDHQTDFFDFENSTPSPDYFADFWGEVSEKDYRMILNGLLSYRKKLGLNDFGYYLLIQQFARANVGEGNIDELITWFLLTKSKFKARIGYNDDRIFLMLPSKQKVFGTSFFKDGSRTYYVMDYNGDRLFTYNEDYQEAYKTFDFSISSPLNLSENVKTRRVTASLSNGPIDLSLSYNQNAIDFYNAIPPIQLDGYFQSVSTSLANRSIVDNLAPLIAGMDDFEIVSYLLEFVQQGFRYQIDDTQFGYEKAFFPEEMLHYSFSDCEDRSVFFAFLVSNFTNLDVIGLDYPAHVAAAVSFDQEVAGDYYIFENKKYVVCDPTYIGAPVGVSMRDFSAKKADIIIQNRPKQVPDTFDGLEVNTPDFEPRILTISNKEFLVANYRGDLTLSDKRYSSAHYSILIAEMEGNSVTKSSVLEANEDIRLLDISSIDNQILLLYAKGEGASKFYVARLTIEGKVVWSKNIPVQTKVYDTTNIQVTLFGSDGNRLAGKTYAETDFFEGQSVKIKDGKILTILSMD